MNARAALTLILPMLLQCGGPASGRVCRASADSGASPGRHPFDLNGDGRADFVATGYHADYVFLGASGGVPSTPSQTLVQPAVEAVRGSVLVPLADFNNDGYADLVLGSRADGLLGYYGGPQGVTESPAVLPIPNVPNDSFGNLRGESGDFNGDGFADAAIPTIDPINTDGFRMDVFLGGPCGLSSAIWTSVIHPNEGEHGTAWSVSGAADFDGDGYADLLLTADTDFSASLNVLRGSPGGFVDTTAVPVASADAWVVGDVNGDSRPDVVTWSASGGLDVYFGTRGGFRAPPSQTLRFQTAFGTPRVVAWGDVTGDGFGDLIAAVPASPMTTWLVLFKGSPSGLNAADNWSLSAPAGNYDPIGVEARDMDGDGIGDTVVVWTTNQESTGTGECWFLHGTPDGPVRQGDPLSIPEQSFEVFAN